MGSSAVSRGSAHPLDERCPSYRVLDESLELTRASARELLRGFDGLTGGSWPDRGWRPAQVLLRPWKVPASRLSDLADHPTPNACTVVFTAHVNARIATRGEACC